MFQILWLYQSMLCVLADAPESTHAVTCTDVGCDVVMYTQTHILKFKHQYLFYGQCIQFVFKEYK